MSNRVGGDDIFSTFFTTACINFETADDILSLATRFFCALGRNDVTLGKRRFVLLLGDAKDSSFVKKDIACSKDNSIYLLIDKRHYPPGVSATTSKFVKHYVCAYGHTFRRGYQSLFDTNIAAGDEFGFNNDHLHAVHLPAAKTILGSVFAHCRELKWISMPNVMSLSDRTFELCNKLEDIVCPQVRSVAEYAFYHCISLRSISLPLATEIGWRAFWACEGLSSVTLLKVRVLRPEAFKDSGLVAVYLPEVETIRMGVFENCALLVSISSPVAAIVGYSAFSDCTSLESISLPSVTSIESRTFASCTKLTSIELPSATMIGRYAFCNCIRLQTVKLPAAREIDEYAFDDCQNLTTVSLPIVSHIELSAFSNCARLNTLPSEVAICRVEKIEELPTIPDFATSF